MKYLMIDFGSTYTKLTAVDTEVGDIIATASHFTTVETDITNGYENALKVLESKIGPTTFDKIIACSSAAGGLKMAAIGLVQELTVEAAKRVCLGAGAKVDLVYSNHLNKSEIKDIVNKGIDIVLLAGGTDGGNSECVLYNAKALAKYFSENDVKIPIVYAGNKSCIDDIEEIFDEYKINGHIVENVMPRLNILNIDSARQKIREIFLLNIIVAKGIKKIEKVIDKVVLPTPEAVLTAANLLSKGYMKEEGLGEIIVLDIGGATTDFYSMSSPHPKRSDIIIKGLEETYAKRTVEGDLGLRYSSLGVVASLTAEQKALINEEYNLDIESEAQNLRANVEMIPTTEHQHLVDSIIAKVCVDKATTRHVGKMEKVFTPLGIAYNQTGKDLSDVKVVIGTGGVLINSKNPSDILSSVVVNPKYIEELRPKDPNYYLDSDYILASMGLLSSEEPVLALQIMKKHLQKLN